MVPSTSPDRSDPRQLGLAELRDAKDALAARLLSPFRTSSGHRPTKICGNVIGVGVGEKYAGGRPTGAHAVTILVRRKLPVTEIAADQRLPASTDGFLTDVVESGGLAPLCAAAAATRATAQLRPGGWVAGQGSSGPRGTIGAVVHAGSQPYILSTASVLAAGSRKSAVYAPLLMRAAWSRIGTLERALPFPPVSAVDAALARLDDPSNASTAIPELGDVVTVGTVSIDQIVHKYGAASGHTAGYVISISTDVVVDDGRRPRLLAGQILVRGLGAGPFAVDGDSGALLVDRRSGAAVGMLVAGSAAVSVANHLTDVLDGLGVALGAPTERWGESPHTAPRRIPGAGKGEPRPFRPALPIVRSGTTREAVPTTEDGARPLAPAVVAGGSPAGIGTVRRLAP